MEGLGLGLRLILVRVSGQRSDRKTARDENSHYYLVSFEILLLM